VVKAVLDTNILIDFLNGREEARLEIRRHTDRAISIITWIEVMAGATTDTVVACRGLLAIFEQVGVTPAVAERTVVLRQQRRMKLPDAVILATAQVAGGMLITRNMRDFADDQPGIRIPYQL
jgi:predicted nucleic acid-binding protein